MLGHSLADMRRVNWLLGWHQPIIHAVQSLLPRTGPYTLLDVATGSGDLPLSLAERFNSCGDVVRLIASDAHHMVLKLGANHTAGSSLVRWVLHDARKLPFAPASVDVATCSSALHHFNERDAVCVLTALGSVARHGVVVADASRSIISLITAGILSRLSLSRLTWHDGPVSVLRSYTAEEAAQLAKTAGWVDIEISRPDPFRWLLIGGP